MSADAIMKTMDQLHALHGSLLQLAVTKTELIKTGDMDSLGQLLKDEQTHVAAITQLEKNRAEQTDQLLTRSGYYGAERTAEKLAAFLPAEQKAQLMEKRDALMDVLTELKERNDLNQKLTFQSLQFVNMSLGFMRPKQETMNYTKTDGAASKNPAQPAGKTFFDSQA